MRFVSHAQNFEDVILRRVFPGIDRGRYIDLGAHDPSIDSVSLAFYEAGWRGMHVEPIPHYAGKLRDARPDETVIEAAVTDATGPICFYELGGLSSGNRAVAERHARAGHVAREMFVPTVRLEKLLETLGPPIHWMKVDVEGMEADVLRSWGESPIRPWVMVIESTFPNTQEPQEHLWINEVTSRGYGEVFFDGLSRYFLHEQHRDLASAFAAPANVFDRFLITPDHFSAGLIRDELHYRDEQIAAHKDRAEQLGTEMDEVRRSSRKAENEFRVGVARFEERIAQLEDKLDRAERSDREAKDRIGIVEGELRELRATAGRLESQRNAANVELARMEERSAQLQDKLDRADLASHDANARLAGLQNELSTIRVLATRLELERDQERKARSVIEGDVEHLRSIFVEVSALVTSALNEPVGISRKILQWLGLARERPEWAALRAWAESRVPDRGGTGPTMNDAASISGHNPYIRANSFAELVARDDVDFVRCAYVTILGRQPDRQGETYYAERIRAGHSKLEILWQIRNSPEASSHDPGIAGLDRALRRARARSWLSRVIRRLVGPHESAVGEPSPPVGTAWHSWLPQNNAKRIEELERDKDALSAELEILKGIVDGLAQAVRGIANAQARHERRIPELRSNEGASARRGTSALAKK